MNADIFIHGKQGMVNEYERWANTAITNASLPFQEAKKKGFVVNTKIPTVNQWIPNTTRAHLSVTETIALRRILYMELALQEFKQSKGKNPDVMISVDDPFSEFGNESLPYKNGKFYSVGENGIDEGGAGDDLPTREKTK